MGSTVLLLGLMRRGKGTGRELAGAAYQSGLLVA